MRPTQLNSFTPDSNTHYTSYFWISILSTSEKKHWIAFNRISHFTPSPIHQSRPSLGWTTFQQHLFVNCHFCLPSAIFQLFSCRLTTLCPIHANHLFFTVRISSCGRSCDDWHSPSRPFFYDFNNYTHHNQPRWVVEWAQRRRRERPGTRRSRINLRGIKCCNEMKSRCFSLVSKTILGHPLFIISRSV